MGLRVLHNLIKMFQDMQCRIHLSLRIDRPLVLSLQERQYADRPCATQRSIARTPSA